MGPLTGRRVLVTRAPAQAGGLKAELEKLGAEVVSVPLIEIREPDDVEPARAATRSLDRYHYVVFASVNAVQAASGFASDAGIKLGQALRMASVVAIGRATAVELHHAGFRSTRVADGDGVEGIARLLRNERLEGARVLLPRAQEGRDELRQWFIERGAEVDAVPFYKTVPDEGGAERLAEELARGVDVVAFASPSAVKAFREAAGEGWSASEGLVIAAIGQTTATAVEEAGMRVGVVASTQTAVGLAAAIGDHFAVKEAP